MGEIIEIGRGNVEKIDNFKYPDGFQNRIPIIEGNGEIPTWGQPSIRSENTISIYEIMGEERPPEDNVFVLIIDGGTGDIIASTAMIESARKFYPNKKIIVGSSHHDMLLHNPNIDKLYNLGEPKDLYERWVKPLKHFGSIMKRDIYNSRAHKLAPGPLSMIWCYLYGIPYWGDNIKIYLTEEEEQEALDFLGSFNREVIIIHGEGAKLTFNPDQKITPNKDWFIDYWTELVAELVKDYDVIQVGGAKEQPIPGCSYYLMGGCSMRATAALLKYSLTFVGIDSFCNHAAAAVGKPGVVLFGRSNPYIASHALHRSLFVKGSCEFGDMFCGRPQGYFGDSEKFRGQGRPWVCPTRSCMKVLTPEIVYRQTMELIKEEKEKQQKNFL